MSYLNIALDCDDTLFLWRQAHEAKFHCKLDDLTSEEITAQVELCKKDKKFWSNLDLLEAPDFIPAIYATKRVNSKVYTRACLIKHHLPIRPIYQIYKQEDNKARIIKGRCDVLIDDSWFNVQQCLSSGVPALLITRPHNKNINTPYRVDHLKYSEIKAKYDQLFGSMQNKVSKH